MILLQGHSISPLKKIPLEEMSLQLKERDSTATIVPADMDGITVNSWMVDDTEPGKGIVWRVKSISQAYATRTPTVQLEHAINTLKDRIMFGEHKPKDITGNSNATTATAEQTIRYILSNQSDWVLWRFDYAGTSNPYQFDGDTLFDALEMVTSSLKDAWWTYDMTVYPFRLNIIRKSNTAYSELRPGRNLKTISKTIDKSGMYTRFYPIGKDDLHLSDYAVDRNTEYYGVISKVDTDASIDTEAELRRWANERLDDHAEPTVTIDVEGLDLADATGEELDRMWLGYCCRIPLAEFGTTITERIVGLTFQDKLRQPEVVKVTLSNNRTDLTKIIADSMKSSGKGKRTSTKQDKEDHAWFEDTDDHVAMCAKGIIGVDAQGNPNWYRLSRLEVNENGIYGEVKSVQNDVVIAETRIDMNENAIKLEAKRASDEEGRLSGQLTVQADRITAEVTRAKDSELQLQGKLLVSADAVSMVVNQGSDTREIKYYEKYSDFPLPGSNLYRYYDMQFHRYYEWRSGGYVRIGDNKTIKAADICTSINESGDPIAVINASKIYLLGETIANTITANYIKAKLANIPLLTIQAMAFTGGISGSGDIRTSGTVGGQYMYLNGQDMSKAIVSASVSGNVLTLTDCNGDSVTFSKATTLTGAWSSGTYTVTASPQGNTLSTTLQILSPDGSVSRSGKYVSRNFKAYYGPDEDHTTYTGFQQTVSIDASSVWDAGQDAKYVDAIRITGNGNRYWDGSTYKQNVGVAADYNTGGSYVTAIAVDVTAAYNTGLDDGWYAYYDSGQWEAPSASNGWKAKIPTRASSSQNETWLTLTSYSQWHPNSLSMYCTEGGQVPGTSIFRYKFTLEASSNLGYVSGKSYPFYY